MLFSLMFVLIDLFVIVIFMAVYGKKVKYSDGMLLGVHIPSYEVQDPEVEKFLADHHKRTRWFYVINMIVSTAVSFLNLLYFSLFISLWCLWLLEFCAGAFLILYRDHRRLYDIKVKRGWQGSSGSKIVVVDTNVSASNEQPLFVDDDIYWKNGWYSNPNDKRLWVQDRFCSANYTTNMARPAGKILTLGTIAVVAVMLIGMCAMFLMIDLTPRYVKVEGEKVTVSAPFYTTDFDVNEIKEAELVDKLPDDHFTRTNGMSDDKQLLGKFQGKEEGKVRLYIYRKYTPILKIVLPDYTVYINGRDKDEVNKWYRDIQEAQELSER